MVPRGGLPRSKKIKVLRRSGTANFSRSSLGFLPTVSHQSLIVSCPTDEALSANAMCSEIGSAQSSSLVANGSVSDPAKNEILVPPESSSEKVNSSTEWELVCSQQEPFSGRPSIEVGRRTATLSAADTSIELAEGFGNRRRTPVEKGYRDRILGRSPSTPKRTVAKHGISGPEIERLDGAVQFMQKHCRSRKARLWWATVNKDSTRNDIAAIQKRITRLQVVENLPPYNATTFETRGGLHAHIIFTGNPEIARRLESSSAFGDIIKAAPVIDPAGLTRRYLAKERTPQAGYGREHTLGGRIRGSHRLLGGGDRVRLSRELERDAIEAGYVEAWQHSNARRSPARKPYPERRATSRTSRCCTPPYRGATMNAPVGPPRSFLRLPKSRHCFGRNELIWSSRKLKLGARVTATIEPDANLPGMWRVRFGGMLSDMANLSRAKDAAISIVLRALNANS
jgi:hypothetical protein